METLYQVSKSLIDPVALLTVVLLVGISLVLTSRRSKVVLLFLPTLLILFILSISPTASVLCRYLEYDYIPTYESPLPQMDVVVVLGGGVTEPEDNGETLLSLASAARLLRAVQALRESGATTLVCTGMGNGRQTEAAVMALNAERLGIERDRILVEPKARNTTEHVLELSRLYPDKAIRIGVVTSAYHLKRSEGEFRRYYTHVTPIPSEFLYSTRRGPMAAAFLPNTGSLFKSATALHEMVGLLWYQVKFR
jgi:uncharacterized SAM-binding protein YcdF (DUF218 family)